MFVLITLSRMYTFLPLVSSIFTVLFTAWASVPMFGYPLGGHNQADISNIFPTTITPAGVTFSIWGIIYIFWILSSLMITFGKIQITPKASIFYSLSIFLTTIWLIPWGYEHVGISLAIILVLNGILVNTFLLTRWSHIFLRSTVELFLGWINVATIVNIAVVLVAFRFSGWGIPAFYWTLGFLSMALLLTAYYQCRYRAYIISFIFLWTLLGIWIAHPEIEERAAVIIYALATLVNIGYSYSKKK